ncbi:MAG TPA: membrane-binding protein [Cyclobacteriaceae bacterium]
MRRTVYILIITLFATLSVSFAQKLKLTNYYDTQNKIIKEVYQLQDSTLNGSYIGYFITGKVRVKGQYKRNKPVGIWEYFYENGNIKMRGELRNNSNYGPWEYFHENGKKSMEGKILNGLRQGLWRFYYPSGKLTSDGIYINNFRSGEWNYYYEDGSKLGVGNYKRGKGLYTEFYPNGNKFMEGIKDNGRSQGNWSIYFEDGKLQALGDYRDGLKEGVWQYFYKNGLVQSEGIYKDDMQSGDWTYYGPSGNMSSKGKLVEGMRDGYWVIFDEKGGLKGEGDFAKGNGFYRELYPDGNIKIEGNIVNELKNGKWSFYYPTGELEGDCIYQNGQGKYVGYYMNGVKKMSGQMDDDIMIGIWELFEPDGSLAGYYRPYYDKDGPIFELETAVAKPKGVSEYKDRRISEFRFKRKKFTPFKPKLNEFKGLIFAYNPFAVFLGDLPVGLEYYVQERLGHEVLFSLKRDPFFKPETDIGLNEDYSRGYAISLRQKYYFPHTKIGILYIGQELRYTATRHKATILDNNDPPSPQALKIEEKKYEYSILLGTRLVKDLNSKGITADIFVGIGTGFRDYSQDFPSNTATDEVFKDVKLGSVPLSFRLGINFGYIFGLKGK